MNPSHRFMPSLASSRKTLRHLDSRSMAIVEPATNSNRPTMEIKRIDSQRGAPSRRHCLVRAQREALARPYGDHGHHAHRHRRGTRRQSRRLDGKGRRRALSSLIFFRGRVAKLVGKADGASPVRDVREFKPRVQDFAHQVGYGTCPSRRRDVG